MLSLIDSEARLSRYVRRVADVTWDLIEMSDKPLTIIYNNVTGLAPTLIAEDGSAGIRIPREESRLCSVQIDFEPFCHAVVSSLVRMSTVMPRTDKMRINLSKCTDGLPSSTSRKKRIPTLAT